MLGKTVGNVVGAAHNAAVNGEAVFLHGPVEAEVALLVDIGMGGGAEIADLPVAEVKQMLDSQFHALGVVHAYVGHVGIAADRIVLEDGRGFAGFKFPQPGTE